jgi:hypothetical protein
LSGAIYSQDPGFASNDGLDLFGGFLESAADGIRVGETIYGLAAQGVGQMTANFLHESCVHIGLLLPPGAAVVPT